MSMENYGGTILTGKTPDLFTRALWQYNQHSHLVAKQEERAKKVKNLPYEVSLFIL
jgi:hypothetical protein